MNSKRNSTVKERIAVAIMFIMVISLFSLADRDTEKLIELHKKTSLTLEPQPTLTASEKAVPIQEQVTRN